MHFQFSKGKGVYVAIRRATMVNPFSGLKTVVYRYEESGRDPLTLDKKEFKKKVLESATSLTSFFDSEEQAVSALKEWSDVFPPTAQRVKRVDTHDAKGNPRVTWLASLFMLSDDLSPASMKADFADVE